MQTSDFDYDLPPELIAQQPAPERTQARMMVVRRAGSAFIHQHVTDLPDYLESGDLLVLNDTRVIPARLFGVKAGIGRPARQLVPPERLRGGGGLGGGGRAEILLIEETAPGVWTALLRARRPRPGARLDLAAGQVRAEVLAVEPEGRVILRLEHARPLPDILEEVGMPPLPPYIKRSPADATQRAVDRERYQTVYARYPGAVAAPTAGLHFTEALLATLDGRGIRHVAVTLHVGPGTFRPVRVADIERHRMEAERYCVSAAAAQAVRDTRAQGGRVVAVGSTVVRALETVVAAHGAVVPAEGRSELFIHPPYSFRAVDAMLTNFHLPRSSLLMMVSALAGRELILRAYAEAIRERYRFYSYGDCMLIL